MIEDRCPNCKAYHIKDADYCVCGYKWVEDVIEAVGQFFETMGIKLEGNR